MDLRLPFHLARGYKSGAQRARVVSEAWTAANLYCCNCASDSLERQTDNTHVIDFLCPECQERYQLKSQRRPFGASFAGSDYRRMMEAVQSGNTPHFQLLHYLLPDELVQNLTVIPRFAISPSAIRRRNPLRASARRAAWVGYVFDLRGIPDSAKIALVREGEAVDPNRVREQFAKIARIESIRPEQRGWTLDVLRCVEALPHVVFTNDEVYAYESELAKLYPANRHIQPKIRQQLQVLRDRGFLKSVKPGTWQRL